MKTVFFAGGGTGGHVYPGLAIANALLKEDEKIRIHFVGTRKGIENKILPNTPFKLHLIPMGRFNNISNFERLVTLLMMPLAFLKTLYLILRFRPKVVFGVGGYASIPVVMLASFLGIKTYIWEPNAMPGMANRLLSKFADQCLVVFEEAKKYFNNKKIEVVGFPVRAQIEGMKVSSKTTSSFNVLVFGGSLGARGINNVVCDAIVSGGAWLDGVRFVHQTGKVDFQSVSEKYKKSSSAVVVDCVEYIHNMEERYAWADLVICRSGAGTLAELAACGKASWLVPFPGAADAHQQKNAENLVNSGAALMCLQSELTTSKLESVVMDLKQNPEKRAGLEAKIKTFHHPQAAGQIAKKIGYQL